MSEEVQKLPTEFSSEPKAKRSKTRIGKREWETLRQMHTMNELRYKKELDLRKQELELRKEELKLQREQFEALMHFKRNT